MAVGAVELPVRPKTLHSATGRDLGSLRKGLGRSPSLQSIAALWDAAAIGVLPFLPALETSPPLALKLMHPRGGGITSGVVEQGAQG